MFGKLFGKRFQNRPSNPGLDGAAWPSLPEGYADGPRELSSSVRSRHSGGGALGGLHSMGHLR